MTPPPARNTWPAIRARHEQAMDLAATAFRLTRQGRYVEARSSFAQAAQLEQAVAETLASQPTMEPTRSILYQSAAALALHAEEYTNALRLALEGIAGTPPACIRTELEAIAQAATSRISPAKDYVKNH